MPAHEQIRIAGRPVGPGAPCYIIAEAGTNHNGRLETAFELIDMAAAAGADAVKFQSIVAARIFLAGELTAEQVAFWRSVELPERWYPELARRAGARGIHFFSTPCYPEAIPRLVAAGVPAIKIASRQAARQLEMVDQAARTGLPLILSLGLCDLGDAHRAVATVRRHPRTPLALLHTIPRYPTAPADSNLRAIDTYRAAFGGPVGLSDHSLGDAIPVAAVARGADLVEKHVTLDRASPGPDHAFAMEPGEFRELVGKLRDVQAALGDGSRQVLPEAERPLYQDSAHYLVLRTALPAGRRLGRAALKFLRTGRGIVLEDLPQALRMRTRRALPAGHVLEWADLEIAPAGRAR